MSHPNVLLLVIDSLRADAVNAEGVETPILDGLAADGTRFLQCVTTSTLTTPAFASLLTGVYPTRHGVHSLRWNRLGNVITMAEAFRSAGYHARAEVTGPLLPRTEVLRGFDVVQHRLGHMQPFMEWRPRVIEDLSKLPQPWFLLLHVWEVHRPYRPPPTYRKRVGKGGYEAIVSAVDEAMAPIFDALTKDTVVAVTGDHGERHSRTRVADRLAAGARDTRRLARLGRWSPRLDRTLARLAIGHGFSLDEPVIRVPWILWGPGVPTATAADLVRHVDIFPTLASLCGVSVMPDWRLQGRDVSPLMTKQALPEIPAYVELTDDLMRHPLRAIRTSEWKLLMVAPEVAYLYRIAPPGASEGRDLSRNHPKIKTQLKGALESIMEDSTPGASPLTADEERGLEEHLRDLGYL